MICDLTLVAVPLPPDREDAYWLAIRTLAELILQWVAENGTQPLDGGGLRSETEGSMDGCS
jgi:hypothetical protein